MSKRIIMIFLAAAGLLALLVAAGCGSQASGEDTSGKLTSEKYAQITVGMSAADLKSVAGEPQKTEKKNMGGGHSMGDGSTMESTMDAEYWYYQGGKGWIRVEVTDGKVSSKSGY